MYTGTHSISGIPYWRYISAEINAEISPILVKMRRNFSPPKLISAEYLSPPNIYLRRIFISTNFFSKFMLFLKKKAVNLKLFMTTDKL